MPKVKLASTWLEACAGCHMSLLDMDERIVELVQAGVEFSSTPITDLKHPDENGVDIGIIEGAIGTDLHEEEATHLRKKCKILIALGDCAVFGGIATMRNYFSREELLTRGYIDTESTKDGKIPTSEELGKLLPKVKAVKDVVKVDYYIPGCPPSADSIYAALKALLEGKAPVLTGDLLKYD